jgi:hypothetical protein
MRKYVMTIAVILVLVLAVSMIMAQTMARDKNNVPIPFGRTFETLTVASADTVWKKVVVPTGTYEAYVRATGGAMLVAADSLYGTIKYEIALQDTIGHVNLPVINKPHFWIRRAAAGTASSVYILYKKF